MNDRDTAMRLLEPGAVVFLVTREEERLDARAISIVDAKDLQKITMITGKSSDKCAELAKNPDCMLYASNLAPDEAFRELRLWGTAQVKDDRETRARTWKDEYRPHFPGGIDDPEFCVIEFSATDAMTGTYTGKNKLDI